MNAVGTKRDRTHRRIVEAASRGVRRAGFRGIGVAEVMKEVGLTHGGFYAHFDSRNALLSEALVHASEDIGSVIRENVDALVGLGHTRFSAFVSTYLSDAQICGQENGCPVAALCSEMPQQSGEVALASRTVIGNLHRLVSDALPEHSRQLAWTVAGALIGAMQLARSLGNADEAGLYSQQPGRTSSPITTASSQIRKDRAGSSARPRLHHSIYDECHINSYPPQQGNTS